MRPPPGGWWARMLIRTFQKAGFTEGDKWRRIEHRCWRVQAKGLQGKPREPWTLAKEPDPRVPARIS